jgi:molecular chaperone GrpE
MENETNKPDELFEEENGVVNGEAVESTPADEIETLSAKVKELEERILRQAADHENHLKRVLRETDEKIKYANQSLLTKFLPVIDSFDLALQHTGEATAESVFEGIKLNRKLLLDTLEKAGLTLISANVGDMFDPLLHEGVMLANNSDLADNSVAMIVQNGYRMAERVVRPVKVQVNKL